MGCSKRMQPRLLVKPLHDNLKGLICKMLLRNYDTDIANKFIDCADFIIIEADRLDREDDYGS